MARYRGILLAAVALVLLLPAAQRADAQDMLIVDGGGARWRSGENREPAVTVDLGIIDSLAADRRPNASRRQYRRPRRYLTLNIPQPEPPAAPLSIGRPAPAAAPAAEPPSKTQTPPARAKTPESPARTEAPEPSVEPKTPAVSAPADRPAALPAGRLPGGTTAATPALRAFLDRAAGNRPRRNATPTMAPTGAPSDSQPSAKPARAKLPPPPRPIKPRQAESNAAEAANPKAGTAARTALPPPAPATAAPAPAGASAAPAVRLPPPPPATGTPGGGVLPPPVEPKAGASTTPRRRLALDAARRPPSTAAASAEAGSERFLYGAGRTTLGKGERERLRGFASKVAGQAGLDIEIRAYSGPVGRDEVEARRTALSRAMEVRRLLISAGLPEARILVRAAGVGEESAGHVDVVPVRRS